MHYLSLLSLKIGRKARNSRATAHRKPQTGRKRTTMARICFLTDATGSTDPIYDAMANSAMSIYNAANDAIDGALEATVIVYRDYSSPLELFEISPAYTDAQRLKDFLSRVQTNAGNDDLDEAGEVALHHALEGDYDLVVMIGDYETHSASTLRHRYAHHGYEHSHVYAKRFAEKGVPVHTLAAKHKDGEIARRSNVVADFQMIAELSGGAFGILGLEGGDVIDMVVTAIIASQGTQDDIDAYMKAHGLSADATNFVNQLVPAGDVANADIAQVAARRQRAAAPLQITKGDGFDE